jgi:hypothetical protein
MSRRRAFRSLDVEDVNYVDLSSLRLPLGKLSLPLSSIAPLTVRELASSFDIC